SAERRAFLLDANTFKLSLPFFPFAQGLRVVRLLAAESPLLWCADIFCGHIDSPLVILVRHAVSRLCAAHDPRLRIAQQLVELVRITASCSPCNRVYQRWHPRFGHHWAHG